MTARNDSSVLSTLQPYCAQAVSAVALSLLCGCSSVGDFGRINSSLVRDDMHAWMGPAAVKGPKTDAGPLRKHQLTDEERRLRDLGYPLIEPPYDRNRWYSALGEYGVIGPWPFPERGAYAKRLFETAYRSQTARYNQLIEDIRNDVIRLDPFFATARYVTDIDLKREKSLAYVSKLTEDERVNTISRIRENTAIVMWVQGALRERAASYRFALERLVIAAPTPNAVEVERQLGLLEQRIKAYSTYEAPVAGPASVPANPITKS